MSSDGHPSRGVLASYATGDLSLAPALVVSAHLERCSACRALVQTIEEAEGRLLAGLPDAEIAEDAFDRLATRLDERAPVAPAVRRLLGDVPLPVGVARVGLGPRRFLSPDFWVAPVRTTRAEGWRAYLLRAPAGAKIPSHLHRGPEFVAVLTGAFQDGRRYVANEFAENLADHEHELTVIADGPCACLVAAQNGARWRGAVGALSPLLGI